MNYGVTPQGFVRKTYNEILKELQNRAASSDYFGEDIDLSDESPIGAEVKLMAWAIDRQWQLAEQIYHSMDINSAEGDALERLTGLGLTTRKGPQYASVNLTFTAEDGKTGIDIPKGTVVKTEQGVEFATSVAGNTGINSSIQIPAVAVLPGPASNVPAETVKKMGTPIAGIKSATNTEKSSGGKGRETDSELRERYESMRVATGSALDAIVASVKALDGVSVATGYENMENFTDANGITAKSIEIIVTGGSRQEIAETIKKMKPAGIRTFGSEVVDIPDSMGQQCTIRFNRHNVVPLFVECRLSVDSTWNDPAGSITDKEIRIKTAISGYIGSLKNGATVYNWKLAALLKDMNGITGITVKLGTVSGSYLLDYYTPGAREIVETRPEYITVVY